MKKHNIDPGSLALSDRDSHKHMQGHGEPTKTGSCGAAIKRSGRVYGQKVRHR